MKLGEKQVLTVVKVVDFGVYLGDDVQRVLLPKKQVPGGIEPGDPVEVFLYKDSSDRLIATTAEPKLTLGKLAALHGLAPRRRGGLGRLGAGNGPSAPLDLQHAGGRSSQLGSGHRARGMGGDERPPLYA